MCKRTWRVWQKKKGRKRKRISGKPAIAFIEHRRTPVRKQGGTRNKNQYLLSKSRTHIAETAQWPESPPRDELIVVADALVKYLEGAWHTWYFILVRPVAGCDAYLLPPYHRAGTEVTSGWEEAFEAVDPAVLSRIQALVCDGHRGLVAEARWRGWKLQRCHFHLLARIQSRRSRWKTGRHQEEGRRIHVLVTRILTEKKEETLKPTLNELEEIGWLSTSPEIRKVLSGFVRHHEDYRTYLSYPKLRLPTTNNTAETLVGLIEELHRRGRGFRTVVTSHEWIVALIKTRKTIACRPKDQPN